ncbi:MAG: alpha/beta hydrolase-fold protein, partial [Acidobacteriaceae bacterium]
MFHGILGDAHWSNGAVAKLVIERFDAGGIDIQRIDLPDSSSYGLTAVYRGTLHGDRIDGTVVWSWNGHWNDRHPTGRWSAKVQNVSAHPTPPSAIKIPPSLAECEVNQCAPGREGGCLWVFHGLEGQAQCRNGALAKLVIQQFDSDGIVIRRIDLPKSPSYGLTGIYTGVLRGNRITGYATYSWPGHWNNHKPSGRWFAKVQNETHPTLPPVPPPLVSPEVHPDGSVTFRVLDPTSQEIFLDLEGATPVIMQKDELGVWNITTAPLRPDYYGYIFRDGDIPLIDPSNPLILPNLLQTENMVHVPGPASLPWEVSDGPHGVVHHHFYTSAVIGDHRDYYVYTPPGYNPRGKVEYPVLYLLHGFGQESRCWTEVGFANRILDHVIDEGKAKPMIVVMPDGYGGSEILAPGAYWNNA